MRTDYPLIFQDSAAVAKYESVVYAPGSYSAAVSRRQRAYLRELVTERFDTPPAHHDFACGTGRALRMVPDLVSAAHGYDVAAAMLETAGELDTEAELHLIAAEGPVPEPVATEGPSLVTMFRLLLNVTPEVRERALAFAAAALPTHDAGLLVVENHGRSRSARHLGSWRHRGNAWFSELSDADITGLLARHGFEVVARRGFALATQGCYRNRLLRGASRRLDDALAAPLGGLATDVLYVARRTDPS